MSVNVVSACCHAGIVGGIKREYPLGGSTYSISYKIDCCDCCGNEVQDYAEVCEGCGEIGCYGACDDEAEEEISLNSCW